MDYNIDGGIGTEVDADSFGDGLLGHNRAYLDWLRGIKAKHPSLIIECCSSGGMRMDYAMLGEGHLQSVSDATDYLKNAGISATNDWLANYPASYNGYPPEGCSKTIGDAMVKLCAEKLAKTFKIIKENDDCVRSAQMLPKE